MFKTKDNLDPMSGNKFVLSNPNVSEEVKAHVVDQDVGDDQAHKQKVLTNVATWSIAAQHSPGGIKPGKTNAYEELIRKGGETPEG
ncbi:uncharacterized protein N7506_005406 [Penicillium brevicompactum]|uniref:uncharacterized protein n=1 Tax=Penicillium brevicompactum TaxID=5074 RepID=UPI002540B142|nr:uncharacterized protein N7506_005406 [Penicillium brevicompactum]KAJ5337384.1 hypothetical protein N7506_005406 [Penicillium brevicompactum]